MQVKSKSLYYSSPPLTILNLSISHFTPFLFIYLYNFHLFVLLFFTYIHIILCSHWLLHLLLHPPATFPYILFYLYASPSPPLSLYFLSPPFSKREKERLQYTSACASKINLCVLFFIIIPTYIFSPLLFTRYSFFSFFLFTISFSIFIFFYRTLYTPSLFFDFILFLSFSPSFKIRPVSLFTFEFITTTHILAILFLSLSEIKVFSFFFSSITPSLPSSLWLVLSSVIFLIRSVV